YQWFHNFQPISGASGSNIYSPSKPVQFSYTIDMVKATNGGSYSVEVKNCVDPILSSTAVLNVIVLPPTISVPPQGMTVAVGDPVTFTVIAGGSAPLAYQWRFNGANISGATSSTYPIDRVQATNAGRYSVVVSNAAGAAASSDAILTVVPQ